MTWQIATYFGVVLVAIALTGVLTWQAWKQRSLPGSRYYFWLAAAMCFMCLAEALSMLGPTQALALFWFKTRFLSFAIIPPLWLLFVLAYSGRSGWITRGLLFGLFVIPLVTQWLVWTNWAGLWIRQEVGFTQNAWLWVADISQRLPGFWFLVHMFTSLALLLGGSILLLRAAWRNAKLFRLQAVYLTASALIPFAVAVLTTFNLLPKGAINPTVLGFALSALLVALAIFRFDFLKQTPAQQEQAARRMDSREKRSLFWYLLLFVLLVAGIGAYAFVSYQDYREKFYAQVEKQLLSIINLKVSGLMEWRAGRLADGEILRRNAAFSSLVQRFLADPSDAKSASDLQSWLESLQVNYKYERVFLLDVHGQSRLSSPASPEAVTADLSGQEGAILQAGQVVFLDLHRDVPAGPIHMAVLVPLYAGADLAHPLGMLVLRMDPAAYLYPYLEQWPASSQTAETLLVRPDGPDVLFLNPLRFQPDAALNQRVSLKDTNVLAVKAVLGQTGVVEGVDYRGQSVIGALAPVPGSPWFLVARMDLVEVDAPLQERLWQMLFFFAVLTLACGAGLVVLWRQQSLRYFRKQAQMVEQLNANQARFHQALDAVHGGVWEWDLQTNENIWSEELWDLYGLEPHSCEPSYETWLQTIHPDDRAAAANAVNEAARAARALSSEWRVTDRNGNERWLMSRGQPILNTVGKVARYIGTAMDITERKQAQQLFETRLRMLEYSVTHTLDEVLQNALDEVSAITHSPIGFYHFVEPDQKTLSLRAWSTRTLQEFCTARGKGSHYSVDEAGVWADCVRQRRPVIHNDYASLPHRKGLPEGHAAVIRELVVPILREDKIVAILGVGNKPVDYTDEDVRIAAYLADIAWEITARKRAEQEAFERSQILHAVNESTANLICVKDRAGKVLSANPAMLRFLGKEGSDVIGKSDLEYVASADQARAIMEDDRQIMESGRTQTLEESGDAPSGSWTILFTKSPFRNAQNEIVGIIGVGVDITARKRAEQELHKSEAQLRAILDATPFPIAVVDLQDDFIRYWSRSALVLFGHTAPTAAEWYALAYPDPQYRREVLARWKPAMETARQTGRPVNTGEYRVACQDGSARICELYAAFLADHLIVTFNDVTDRVKSEKELEHQRAELSRSNTELEQFAYVASHDLQEPLRMVTSYMDLLKRRYQDRLDQDANEFIGFAVDGATRMQRLINDLLTYSRVGTRARPFAPVACDAVLDAALANLQVTIRENDAAITRAPLPQVLGDDVQLLQLFQNLVGNAIKFHGEKPPQVHISASLVPLPSGDAPGLRSEWLFAVRDNGIGLDPQYAERIFIIFQRLHGRDKYAGTGIGLAICKKIVQRHGGRIWVESTPGQGATFFFTLPQ